MGIPYHYETRRAEAPAIEDEDGNVIELPSKWAICGTCRGNGSHSHRFGALTSDRFNEWDLDERRAYARGDFDEACTVCDGTGKIRVIDEARCTPEQLASWRAEQKAEAEVRAEEAAERQYFYGC
jgi:hypothetical protein